MALISRIIEALEEAGKPLRVAEIAARVNTTVPSIRSTLSRALGGDGSGANRVRKVGRGLYDLREKDRDLGLTWHEAITLVLEEAQEAMHYGDIATEIVDRNLTAKAGSTPARTVAAVLSQNRDKRFIPVDRGRYGLVDHYEYVPEGAELEHDNDDDDDDCGTTLSREEPLPVGPSQEAGPASQVPFLTGSALDYVAFGMYWSRDAVLWSASPALLGVQSHNQKDYVDFSEQRGIYLLHRGHQTVYVGKAVTRGIGQRLSDHTKDRHSGRWDSFSWLGFREVSEDGTLEILPARFHVDAKLLIALMEFWLIESVEPALNRKQGDTVGFEPLEFLQREDPGLEKRRKKEIAADLLQGLS